MRRTAPRLLSSYVHGESGSDDKRPKGSSRLATVAATGLGRACPGSAARLTVSVSGCVLAGDLHNVMRGCVVLRAPQCLDTDIASVGSAGNFKANSSVNSTWSEGAGAAGGVRRSWPVRPPHLLLLFVRLLDALLLLLFTPLIATRHGTASPQEVAESHGLIRLLTEASRVRCRLFLSF